jgi:DNA polymerase-3 subunit delta
VVIVREAQEIRQMEDLSHYAAHPLSSTILVINYKYKKLDKRKKLYKILDKHALVFDSKRLYEDRIPQWINQLVSSRNTRIEPKAAAMLTEYLGTDLGRIEAELDKLMLVMEAGNDIISPAQVEENIGISKDFNQFELNNAIAQRNVLKANRIARYFASNPKSHPLVLTLTSIYFFFSKVLNYHFTKDRSRSNLASVLRVDPYFIPDYEKAAKMYPPARTVKIIALLREYDRKSKGIGHAGTPPGELLKELVYKILH